MEAILFIIPKILRNARGFENWIYPSFSWGIVNHMMRFTNRTRAEIFDGNYLFYAMMASDYVLPRDYFTGQRHEWKHETTKKFLD